jgi:hypothetical protein
MLDVAQTGRFVFCRVTVRESWKRTAAMAAGVPHGVASVSLIHADRTTDPNNRDPIGSSNESPESDPLADLESFAKVGFGWRRVKRGETA